MSPGFLASTDAGAVFAQSDQRAKSIEHLRRTRRLRSVRITAIEALDQGEISDSASGDTTLDTSQDSCSGGDDEPFFDSLLRVTLQNSGVTGLKVRRLRFKVRAGNSDGSNYRSPRFSPIGAFEIEADSSGLVYGPLLEARDGRKHFADSEDPVDVGLGFRAVRVIVKGINFRRERFRVRRKTTFSFGVINRC